MSKKNRESNRTARAAAIQKQQASRERNRKALIVVVVLVVLAAVVTAGVLLSGGDKPTPGAGAGSGVVASGESIVVGTDPGAKVKVVVYEDFLCPYCREFESTSRAFVRDEAGKGKVLVEYRPFQLIDDEYSTLALTAWAAVLQNGTPKQALAFHDLLFENQPYEATVDKPGVAQLGALAKKAGVRDQAVLDAFGKENAEFVTAAGAAATEADVRSTPTVLVNGKELEGSPSAMADQLRQLIAQG